jgi:Transposase IS116/IS110/IS902 family
VLLRGGMLPQAYVYAAAMRATRELLRRRGPLGRKRAELLAHLHNPTSPSKLPEIGKKRADKAHREGVEDPFPAPRVRTPLEGAIALIAPYAKWLGEVELSIPRSATAPEVQTFARLQSLPGVGQIVALVLLSESQASARFPRGQDVVSYCPLAKGAKESGGKRLGTAGKTIGNVHLRWAFAEAAVVVLRHHQPGKAYCAKLEHHHGKATALTVLAHQLARAGYDKLAREHAFDRKRLVTA